MTKIGVVGVFLFAIALIVACAPSQEEAPATAIAAYDLTQAADPYPTPTITPLHNLTPKATSNAHATQTTTTKTTTASQLI